MIYDQQAEFRSRFGVEESQRRLAVSFGDTGGSLMSPPRPGYVVRNGKIELSRPRRASSDSPFKPQFTGEFFRADKDSSCFAGRFDMHPTGRRFFKFWIACLAVWFLLTVAAAARSNQMLYWILPASAILLGLLGLGILRIARAFYAADVDWIKRTIHETIE